MGRQRDRETGRDRARKRQITKERDRERERERERERARERDLIRRERIKDCKNRARIFMNREFGIIFKNLINLDNAYGRLYIQSIILHGIH